MVSYTDATGLALGLMLGLSGSALVVSVIAAVRIRRQKAQRQRDDAGLVSA
jgi:hypothetical protein